MTSYRSVLKINLAYCRSFLPLLIPIIFLSVWYKYYPNAYNSFLLLTQRTTITDAKISNSEEIEDYIDLYGGNHSQKTLEFTVSYKFISPEGKVVSSIYEGSGTLPTEIVENYNFYNTIDVKFLNSNPTINTIHASWAEPQNLWQWFRQDLLTGIMLFIFCCAFSIFFFKQAIAKYRVEK